MCELLGMSFNLPVTPSISFRGFCHRGEANPHGWGVAFYPDKSAQVIKEPVRAENSRLSDFLKDYEGIKSKIFIGHVRYASEGDRSHRNTHPFCRELYGREYVFAHNGTLYYGSLSLGRFNTVGETDSEHAFCYLLQCFEEEEVKKWNHRYFDWLSEILMQINEYGEFNCIFSDGEYLFCYYDKDGYNTLCFLHRKPPYEKVCLLDEDWEINFAQEKRPEQTGYIIATRALTDEEWQNFEFGELIVFKDGKMVYSNKRSTSEPKRELTAVEKRILEVLRSSPHRLSLREIRERLKISADDEVKSKIHSLLCKGYIRQDKRDEVKWNSEDATFYTEPLKRELIDELIK